MFVLSRNLLSLQASSGSGGRGIRRSVLLCCIALIVTSAGCKQDCAQWKIAAAINEKKNANPEEAIELLETALRADPESHLIKIGLANLLAEHDQGDLGLTLCDEILESNPSAKYAWRTRSRCLRSLGRFDEALADCQKYYAHSIDKDCWELNELAYDRGLAGVELDKALRQVNLAVRKYEQQQGWGINLYNVPLEISSIVSASLISRHTDAGHLLVLDLLNNTIFEEQRLWLEMNSRLERLISQHEKANQQAPVGETEKMRSKRQKDDQKKAAKDVQLVSGNLTVLLATRSLIFEDQGQSKLADLDRLWLEQIGFKPQTIYDALPNDTECFRALQACEHILDTRGYLLTQMPWQPTWTAPTGAVIQIGDTMSRASYGSYNKALRDLDIAVASSEIHLLALDTDIVNRIDFPIRGLENGRNLVGDLRDIRGLKAMGARMVAVLRNHRRQAHLKANQLEAAEKDLVRIKELGFEAGPSLF